MVQPNPLLVAVASERAPRVALEQPLRGRPSEGYRPCRFPTSVSLQGLLTRASFGCLTPLHLGLSHLAFHFLPEVAQGEIFPGPFRAHRKRRVVEPAASAAGVPSSSSGPYPRSAFQRLCGFGAAQNCDGTGGPSLTDQSGVLATVWPQSRCRSASIRWWSTRTTSITSSLPIR